MAVTSDQLAALDEAIASGVLTVEHGGKKVTYRSMAELMQARSMLARALGQAGPSVSYATYNKGL